MNVPVVLFGFGWVETPYAVVRPYWKYTSHAEPPVLVRFPWKFAVVSATTVGLYVSTAGFAWGVGVGVGVGVGASVVNITSAP